MADAAHPKLKEAFEIIFFQWKIMSSDCASSSKCFTEPRAQALQGVDGLDREGKETSRRRGPGTPTLRSLRRSTVAAAGQGFALWRSEQLLQSQSVGF